jgi:hypothetical protein
MGRGEPCPYKTTLLIISIFNMKKFLSGLAFLLIGLMISAGAEAQKAEYKVSNPYIYPTGSFSQPVQYVPTNSTGPQIFPWYTASDTVTANRKSYKDSFKCKLPGVHEGVYTWLHSNTYSGTNPSIYKLWASADSNKGVDFVQVYSVSVSATATNPVASYQFTNPFMYSNFFWSDSTGTGDSVIWYSGLMVR